MNTERLLQEINKLEEQIQALKTMVSENEKIWAPSNGEQYYTIGQDFNVSPQIWNNHPLDKQAYRAFNYFKTEERAEQVVKKLKRLLKLEHYHDMFCPDYVPDWNNEKEVKYYMYFDNLANKWDSDITISVEDVAQVYFNSGEAAYEVRKLLNEEEF